MLNPKKRTWERELALIPLLSSGQQTDAIPFKPSHPLPQLSPDTQLSISQIHSSPLRKLIIGKKLMNLITLRSHMETIFHLNTRYTSQVPVRNIRTRNKGGDDLTSCFTNSTSVKEEINSALAKENHPENHGQHFSFSVADHCLNQINGFQGSLEEISCVGAWFFV
jgi:hypothetical protein